MNNNSGYGDKSPLMPKKINVQFFKVFFALVLVVGLVFTAVFSFNSSYKLESVVTADAIIYTPDTNWVDSDFKVGTGGGDYTSPTSSISSLNTYKLSDGYYCSSTNGSFKYDKYSNTWLSLTFSVDGSTTYNYIPNGRDVWSDGVNYYYNDTTHSYIYNGDLSWSTIEWDYSNTSQYPNFVRFIGRYVHYLSANNTYYYDSTTYHYRIDTQNRIVYNNTWVGLPGNSFYGDSFKNIYGNDFFTTSNNFRVFDSITGEWVVSSYFTYKPSNFDLRYVYTFDKNIYYFSYGTSQYYLTPNNPTNWLVWSPVGLTSFYGSSVKVLDSTLFYSSGTNFKFLRSSTYTESFSNVSVSESGFYINIDLLYNSSLIDDLEFVINVSNNTSNYYYFMTFDFASGVSDTSYNYTNNRLRYLSFYCPYKYIKFELYSTSGNISDYVQYYERDNFSIVTISDNRIDSNDYSYLYYNFDLGSMSFPNSYRNNIGIGLDATIDYFGTFNVYNAFNGQIIYTYNNPFRLSDFRLYGYDIDSTVVSSYYSGYYQCLAMYNYPYYCNYTFSSHNYNISNILSSVSLYTNVDIRSYLNFDIVDFLTAMNVTNSFSTPSIVLKGDLESFSIYYNYTTQYLTWSNVMGADYYQIYLDDVLIVDNFIGNQYKVTSIGSYKVYAVPQDINYNGSFSNVVSVVATPLTAPVVSLNYSNISWSAVAGADYYQIFIFDNNLNDYVLFVGNVNSTGYTLIQSGTYVVKAVSSSSMFTDSAFSNSVEFDGVWTPGGGSDTGTYSFATLIGAVIDVPVHYAISMLDFDLDFLGINLLSLLMSLMSLIIVIWVIRFVLGHKRGD